MTAQATTSPAKMKRFEIYITKKHTGKFEKIIESQARNWDELLSNLGESGYDDLIENQEEEVKNCSSRGKAEQILDFIFPDFTHKIKII